MGVYDSATSADEVDVITAQRIRDLYGSVDEELKALRNAILSVFVLQNPRAFGDAKYKQALVVGQELLDKNGIIEKYILEGKNFKQNKGW